MLKSWYEAKPFTFGAVFIFFYMTIPIVDQLFLIPKMKPVCTGQITDEQVRQCTNWIKKKDSKHVSHRSTPPRGVYGNTSSDSQREWERQITTFGAPTSKE